MKKFYTSLYNFFIVAKVLCPVISFLYALLWLLSFFNSGIFPILKIPFEPFAQFAGNIIPFKIDYEGQLIDMSYIVSSGLFIGFHYLFGFFADRVIDLYNFEETKQLEKRNKEVKSINAVLKKEFEQEVEKYATFTLLFSLDLKPAYNLAVSRKGEFDLIKKEFYSHVVKDVSSKYRNSKGIISDKLFLVCDDIKHFDSFILNFLDELKAFNASNSKKDITTEFSISVNAIKLGGNVFKAMEFLEKIDSFNYKNKLVCTSAFKMRYDNNPNPKFKIVPLGISRFFIEPDDFEDFELFNLKPKKR